MGENSSTRVPVTSWSFPWEDDQAASRGWWQSWRARPTLPSATVTTVCVPAAVSDAACLSSEMPVLWLCQVPAMLAQTVCGHSRRQSEMKGCHGAGLQRVSSLLPGRSAHFRAPQMAAEAAEGIIFFPGQPALPPHEACMTNPVNGPECSPKDSFKKTMQA